MRSSGQRACSISTSRAGFLGAFPRKSRTLCRSQYAIDEYRSYVLDDNKGVSVSIDGVAAGREPRAAAEDLRQLLVEQLSQNYHDVKVEFKGLEDLDTIANVGGTNMPMAHYILIVTFNPLTAAKPAVLAPTERVPKR